ncbi:MAG: glycine cleavage system aminomethyltransferase GcvT, partial [Microlunatus sp.]|nr:glycine cleavage system aminomethyltransferase GcvT [Microlunatus sp.]
CGTADLRKIQPGQAQYTLICNDDGGVIDDMIAYLNGPDDVFLIPNAGNCAEVARLLTDAAPAGVSITNEHDGHAVFAIQGPHSDQVLADRELPTGHGYMSFVRAELDGVPLTVCRTGYTGERGYELVTPSAHAGAVWDAVVEAGEPYGIQLAGLGARDTLRTEMGYPLHGHDISPDISPVQARLGWAVGWKKDAFFGDAALRAEREATPNRMLWGLKAVKRGIPRPGMLVRDADGHEIGSITSGTFSPTLKTGIALALLDARFSVDEQVEVEVRNRREPFIITKPPFVTPGVREP